MKTIHLALITTGLTLAVGLTFSLPIFLVATNSTPKQVVMLSFSINDDVNMPDWCNQLSAILEEKKTKATIFLAGKMADQYPQCVSNLSNNNDLDIGSKTYSYVSLDSIQDYSLKLEEVRNGKRAVDAAGNIDSRLFKAPQPETGEDIYSLLDRTGILADFSYPDMYNKRYGDYYIKFDVTSYDVRNLADLQEDSLAANTPVIMNFDNTYSIDAIHDQLERLNRNNIRLVNASELTDIPLTIKGPNNQ